MVTAVIQSSIFSPLPNNYSIRLNSFSPRIIPKPTKLNSKIKPPILFCSAEVPTPTTYSSSSSSSELEGEGITTTLSSPSTISPTNAPLRVKRRRYRKQYPGEKKGITEEMRFVAMKLMNTKFKIESEDDHIDGEKSWEPSMEGFVKFVVDSKLLFNTVERIVDESSDVSYAYFRNTGLERSQGISEDLEWFSQRDIVFPEPSNPGVSYAKYLEELAEMSPPLFLSHFYNIYFSHIAGGQVIAKMVSKKLLKGREMAFYRWDGDAEELFKGVRENLNMLGEHWSRDDKNKCLREAMKSFRFMGQIVRLIVL